MIAYYNGAYLPKDTIAISPDDRAFLFGDGLYEVVRWYPGTFFCMNEHLDRLSYGATALHLNQKKFDFFKDIAHTLIEKNALIKKDAIVYMQITRGVADRTHTFPDTRTTLTCYAFVRFFDAERQKQEAEYGIDTIIVSDQRWARCDIKTLNLIANVLAQQEAKEKGAKEALFLRDGFITEGSHSNIFAVLDGYIITPPKTNYILGGITRQVILDLCKKERLRAVERPVSMQELLQADEVFITGTTVEITPVIKIDNTKIGAGRPGVLTEKMQGIFQKFKEII